MRFHIEGFITITVIVCIVAFEIYMCGGFK